MLNTGVAPSPRQRPVTRGNGPSGAKTNEHGDVLVGGTVPTHNIVPLKTMRCFEDDKIGVVVLGGMSFDVGEQGKTTRCFSGGRFQQNDVVNVWGAVWDFDGGVLDM